MKKKSISIVLALIMTSMCACNANTQEEKGMAVDNSNDGISVTEQYVTEADSQKSANSSEDLSSFASGIKTDDEAKGSDTEFVLDDEIEERCPVTIEATRSYVEYGEFTHGTYYSETCGLERGYSILLPADYNSDKQYPVLYLLHGIFGDEYSFSQDGNNKIKEIVGNMAADGYIEETIIVCPNMYASSDPDQKPAFDTESCLPYDNFINDQA